jgi:hypothetical protein
MSFLNLTKVADSAPAIIPAGKYLVSCSEARVENLFSGNGKKISCVFKIMSGEFKGRNIYHNFIIEHTNPLTKEIGLKNLKNFMVASECKLTLASVTDLLGKFAYAHVGLKNRDGVDTPTIKFFESAKEANVQMNNDLGF